MESRKKREAGYSTWPSLLLAIMMVVTGILLVCVRMFPIEYGDDTIFVEDNDFGTLGRFVIIIGGFIIFFTRKKGNYFTVGIYALTLGLSRVIRSLPGLLAESDFVFYYSLVFTIIGGNLAWGGYNHLTVKTRNPGSMKYMAMLLLSVYGLVLGYSLYIGEDTIHLFLSEINMMGYLPLYIGLLAVLYTKEVNENAPLGRISKFLNALSANTYIGNSIRISEQDSEKVKEGFSGGGEWKEIRVGDRVIKENVVEFHTHNGCKDVILEIWPDSNGMYISVINDRTDSFIGGQRFMVTGYEVRGDLMDLYDPQGVRVRMRIDGDIQ